MPNKVLLLNRILYIYIYFSNSAANLSKIYLRPIASSCLSKGQLMICRGVGNINNYNSLWLLVYKKLHIIQSYSQPIFKASTNSHRLRNSCARQRAASCTRDILVCGICTSLYQKG